MTGTAKLMTPKEFDVAHWTAVADRLHVALPGQHFAVVYVEHTDRGERVAFYNTVNVSTLSQSPRGSVTRTVLYRTDA